MSRFATAFVKKAAPPAPPALTNSALRTPHSAFVPYGTQTNVPYASFWDAPDAAEHSR